MITRVVVFGYDRLVLSTLKVMTGVGAEVVAVVFPSARSEDQRVSQVRAEVQQRGHPVLTQPPGTAAEPFVAELRDRDPDIGVVWSYPMILPPQVLLIPRLGCVNLHPARLPQYRGTNVIQWTLINGESHTAMTLHQMDHGLDTGPILAQSQFEISPNDDLVTLMRRSKTQGEALLARAWQRLVRGEILRQAQDEEQAAYYSALTASDRRIDWTSSNAVIANQVRALVAPDPGAWTSFQGEHVVVRAGAAVDDVGPAGAPGEILAAGEQGLSVMTGAGVLRVQTLEVHRRPETPDAFRIRVGGRFGS